MHIKKNIFLTCDPWKIALTRLSISFIACGCTPHEIPPVTNPEVSNTSVEVIKKNTDSIKPMPILAISDCNELHKSIKENITKISIKSNETQVVNNILNSTRNHHSSTIFRFMPDQVMWFTRISGAISIQSLGTAIHESNHIVDAALTYCNNGFATYLFEGHVIKTDHKFGDSLQYSIAADMLPPKLKTSSIGSRFHQYIELNGSHAKSDFSILLDELVAYTGAASLDISILRSTEYSWLVDRKIAWLDVNPGGMADFMIYTLAYLKALRINYPEAYLRLQQQPKTLALLQTIWTAAETTLMSAYDLTKNANSGGILIISRDAISEAYSDEFISELNRIGVSHASMNDWSSSYLKMTK